MEEVYFVRVCAAGAGFKTDGVPSWEERKAARDEIIDCGELEGRLE